MVPQPGGLSFQKIVWNERRRAPVREAFAKVDVKVRPAFSVIERFVDGGPAGTPDAVGQLNDWRAFPTGS